MTFGNEIADDVVIAYKLHGDGAANYKPLVERLINQIGDRSSLEGGGGEGSTIFHPDANTTINVRLDAEGPAPQAFVTITRTAGLEKGKITQDLAPLFKCPYPYGKAGARMFSQILDLNEGDSVVVKDLAQVYLPVFGGVDFCDPNQLPPTSGVYNLKKPFRYMGGLFNRIYTLHNWVGFNGGNFFNFSQFAGPTVFNAPCTFQDAINGPNVQGSNPDNGNIISMFGTPGVDFGCQGNLQTTRVWEGEVYTSSPTANWVHIEDDLPDPMGRGGGESDGRVVAEGAPDPRTMADAIQRSYVIINFSGGPRPENEIVLLHPQGGCLAAIGLFYGGPDGAIPWEFKPWAGVNFAEEGLRREDQDEWLAPQFCPFKDIEISNSPPLFGGYLIGAKNFAAAWIQGNGTTAQSNPGAKDNLNSRTFWFFLDGAGIPRSFQGLGGLAQESLEGGDNESERSVGGDLAWSSAS